jgi:hypothetical protein
VTEQWPALEKPCGRCGETGFVREFYTDGREYLCPDCEGDGRVPTEFGAAVLEFVRKHLKPRVTM